MNIKCEIDDEDADINRFGIVNDMNTYNHNFGDEWCFCG